MRRRSDHVKKCVCPSPTYMDPRSVQGSTEWQYRSNLFQRALRWFP